MVRQLNISQEIEFHADWEKLAKDLKEKFNIEVSEKDIEAFCCDNEIKYLTIKEYEQDIEEIHRNDLTGDENLIKSSKTNIKNWI